MDSSLRGIREALYQDMGEEVTDEKAIALFMASSFVMPTVYASRRYADASQGDDDDPLHDIQRVVGLFRGIRTVMMTAPTSLGTNIVPHVFGNAFEGPLDENPEWFTDYMQGLEGLKSYISMRPDLDDNHRYAAMSGLRALVGTAVPDGEELQRLRLLNPAEMRIVFFFPFRMQDDFVDLLRARSPPVMAVFLYYCAVMHLAEQSCWFFFGWASRQAKSIEKDLRDTPWLALVRWPVHSLGLE